MLERATAQKALLERRGMSEQLLADVAAAVLEFEKTLEATRAGRRDHPSLRSGQVVGASADLRAVAAQVAMQMRLLDGLVRYRFGDNAELMGAWASARNVHGPLGSRGDAVAPGGVRSSPLIALGRGGKIALRMARSLRIVRQA
jgi:hypothetical protein